MIKISLKGNGGEGVSERHLIRERYGLDLKEKGGMRVRVVPNGISSN